MLRANFVKFGRRKVSEIARCLPDKEDKNSPGFPVVAIARIARIAPKICIGNLASPRQRAERAPDFLQIGSPLEELPKRVNTVKAHPEVFPIFDFCLASSRIITKLMMM